MKLLLALLLACSPALSEKVGDLHAPKAYVDDYANVMTTTGKAQVEAVCREVHDKTKAQIFVVTIKSLDGEPIAPFANDLFHNWKIGEKKTDRGVLVLLVQDSHRWRIEVGYGLEGILPDAKAGRIGRAMDPLIKAGNYDAAAESSVDAIAAVIAEDAGVALAQPASEPVAAVGPVPEQENDPTGAIVAFAIICAFCLIALMRYLRRRPARITGYPGNATSDAAGLTPAPLFFGSDTNSSSSSADSSGSSDSFSGGDGGDSGGGGADGGGE
jgi:uncharacterized protein